MSSTVFITTDIAHRDCTACADCVDAAIGTARVTGSVGATYEIDKSRTSGLKHYATVHRADKMHELHSDAQEAPRLQPMELPVQVNRQAPAAEALLAFLRDTATASQAIPGSDVRLGVLRWASDQGLPTGVRIALGDLVLQVVNYKDEVLAAAG